MTSGHSPYGRPESDYEWWAFENQNIGSSNFLWTAGDLGSDSVPFYHPHGASERYSPHRPCTVPRNPPARDTRGHPTPFFQPTGQLFTLDDLEVAMQHASLYPTLDPLQGLFASGARSALSTVSPDDPRTASQPVRPHRRGDAGIQRASASSETTTEPVLVGLVFFTDTKGPLTVRCNLDSCLEVNFARPAELKRHYIEQHAVQKPAYFCPVPGCARGREKGDRPFRRADKRNEHARRQHEVIVYGFRFRSVLCGEDADLQHLRYQLEDD